MPRSPTQLVSAAPVEVRSERATCGAFDAQFALLLTAEQLRVFAADGFVLVRGAVPEDLLSAADLEIDALVAADPPPAGTVGYLSDESCPDSGNLWVWPGSHRVHQGVFASRGVDVLRDVSGHAALLDPPVDFGIGRPLLARRGDLLLAHYLLGQHRRQHE